MGDFLGDTRRSYDVTADDYAEWIRDEPAAKPFARSVLAVFAAARRTYPHLRCTDGTMTALPVGDGVLGGVVAWYSTIHVPDPHLPATLAEFHREPARMADLLRDNGFTVKAQLLREPDPDGPYPENTPQSYVLACAHG